jgi:hypothetical protein
VFASQMIATGTVKPEEIVATVGVLTDTVMPDVKLCQDRGAKGFYEPKPRPNTASVLKVASTSRLPRCC